MRKYDLRWVVDMDLSKCFDTLDHELIIQALRKRIVDGSILKLVRKFLESGVMEKREWQATTVGSPQGGVISPLIANIYLDAFDQEMKRRGHRIVRYADDILILTRTKKAAENVMEQAGKYLEGPLKLTVNKEKTHIVHVSEGVKYLGVVISSQHTAIQEKKLQAFKEKVRKITRRNSPVNLEQLIKELNPLCRGFANYFRIANCKGKFRELMQWIRRRLRAKQMTLWKKAGKLHRVLRRQGYKGDFKAIKMGSWRNAACQLAHMALPNKGFEELGLFSMDKVETGISVPLP
jgi:group II intron reverse transcriptase/maturase